MEYITSTELRTKSPELISALRAGKSIKLLHRSKVIGDIRPFNPPTDKPINIDAFIAAVDKLSNRFQHIPKDPKKRAELYRQHVIQKYGQPISRR